MNIFFLFTNIFIFVLCGGIFMIIPQLTRKSYLFGVRIPPEEAGCDEAIKLRKTYTAKCVAGMTFLILLSVVQYLVVPELTFVATLYFPFLLVLLFFVTYVPNWKKAARLKKERGWAVSNVMFADTKTANARGKLSNLPWAWYAVSFVAVLVSVAFVISRMPHMPDMMPVHFDAAGVATRYAETSWFNMLIVPLANASLVALMLIVNIIIERTKLQIDHNKPALSFAQHRVYRRRMGHAIGFITLGTVIMITPLVLPMIYPGAEWTAALMRLSLPVIVGGSVVLCIVPLVAYVLSGQGGCKIKIDVDEAVQGEVPEKTVGRGDDKYWILGTFYYNPDDPAVFVEDRFGSNFGLNYARVSAKIFVGALAVVLVATYFLPLVWSTVSTVPFLI